MQMELGLEEDDPTARPASPLVERRAERCRQPKSGVGVLGSRSRRGKQVARQDFGNLMFGYPTKILVRRAPLCRH
jgi:hypothetical protein